MIEDKAIVYILGLMVAIIGYFVKGIISDLRHLKINDANQDREIAVIKANHENLHQSVDELKIAVRDLNNSIRELISKMNK